MVVQLIVFLMQLFLQSAPAQAESGFPVLTGPNLSSGFGMGVDSSEKRRDWLATTKNGLHIAYPAGQSWGAVFITFGGDPKQPPRPSKDFSDYKTLVVEMKGTAGAERVQIGLKDNTDPDDGSETKINQSVTSDWKEYTFPLDRFPSADLKRLYVVTEFVFSGPGAQTIFVRKVGFGH